MHVASLGGIPFDCISTSDAVSRAVAEQNFPRKDGAHLQDMGAGARRTRLTCIFFEVPPEGGDPDLTYLERYQQFYLKANSGETLDFVHPIFGSYRAKVVGDISTDATSEDIDSIIVELTLVEDSTDPSPFDFSASQPVDAGIAATKVAEAKMSQALADSGLSSTVGADAVSQVSAWRTDETVSPRRVNLELKSLTERIGAEIVSLSLDSDLSLQPVWRSMQTLQGEIRRAAQLFHQQQPQIFTFTVRTDTPLRVIVTDMYGASEANTRYDELMRLNDIDDPMLIRAGTQLSAASPEINSGKVRSTI